MHGRIPQRANRAIRYPRQDVSRPDGVHPDTPLSLIHISIASRNPTAAHDAMYLHLVYNRNMIAEGTQEQSE